MRRLLARLLLALAALGIFAAPATAQRIGPGRVIHASVGVGLGTLGADAAIRVVPISSTEAFLVAPHAQLGAIALHLVKGNPPGTPLGSADAGGVFGDWRIYGFRVLPSVASDPVSQASETIYAGTGSQQIAINVGGVFAGQYHGLGAGAAYSQTAPSLTAAAMIVDATIASAGELRWSGATATWSDSFALRADGSIATSATATLPADPFNSYLDMTIVSRAFSRASLDGGATWVDMSGYGEWQELPASVASITLRNPATGTTITVTDDALNGVPGRLKVVTSRSSDFKIYANLDPSPTGTQLGTVSVTRTITFGKTAPDPIVPTTYVWRGAVDYNTGYVTSTSWNNAMRSWDATAKQLVFTRAANVAGGTHRTLFLMTGLTPGQAYTLPILGQIIGSSGSAGVTIGVSTDLANGGSQGATVMNMSAAVASGTTPYTFTATAATMALVINQGAASGDNVFRLSTIGPLQ